MLRSFKELHPWKADCPMYVTDCGMLKLVNDVQPAKAESPIKVKDPGRVKQLLT